MLDRFSFKIEDDLRRSRWWYLGAFLFLFFAGACGRAWMKPFWYDEIFTLTLSGLSLSDLRQALATGMEQNPPLYLLLNGAVSALLGQGHVAMRLLSMAGLCALSLSLYMFVSRRSGPVAGWVALLAPLFTEAYSYAWEARPYGLLLGCCGVSLVAWQRACEGGRRVAPMVLLGLSLSAAVSSHYYAVLLYIPLAAGELARFFIRRKPDPLLWLMITASTMPLLVFASLMRGASAYSAGFWAQPSIVSVTGFWEFLLAPALWPAMLALVLAAVAGRRGAGAEASGLERHEIAAAAGLLAVPLVLLALAFGVTHAYSDRYALPAAAGVAILTATLAGRRTRTVAFTALFSLFILRQSASALLLLATPSNPVKGHPLLEGVETGNTPVVVANGLAYLQLAHYAPPALASRLEYLADPRLAARHTGSDSVDRALLDLRRWRKLRVREYEEFRDGNGATLLYQSAASDDGGRLQWIADELRAGGAGVALRAQSGGRFLFEVTWPAP